VPQTAQRQQRILTLRNLCFSYYNYYKVYTIQCKVEDKKSVETIDCKNKLKTAINNYCFRFKHTLLSVLTALRAIVAALTTSNYRNSHKKLSRFLKREYGAAGREFENRVQPTANGLGRHAGLPNPLYMPSGN
jgi:hypothetical protein